MSVALETPFARCSRQRLWCTYTTSVVVAAHLARRLPRQLWLSFPALSLNLSLSSCSLHSLFLLCSSFFHFCFFPTARAPDCSRGVRTPESPSSSHFGRSSAAAAATAATTLQLVSVLLLGMVSSQCFFAEERLRLVTAVTLCCCCSRVAAAIPRERRMRDLYHLRCM